MDLIAYAYDVVCAQHLSQALHGYAQVQWCDEVEALKNYHNRVMILILPDELWANEPIVRELIKNENKVLLLQRVPLLESAKYYLALGVSGYGNALMHSVYFHSALETINLQMIWLHPQLTAQLVGSIAAKNDRNFLSLLSEREKEISRYLLEGKSNHEIGDILNITPRTVKAHASHIYHKLQVKDRLDFALRYK